MKKFPTVLLLTTSMALIGCGDIGRQWLNPDKTFQSFPQPEIKTINDTQEDMAKEALAVGDISKAGAFYEQLVATGRGTAEQKLRYKIGLADCKRRVGDNEQALGMYNQLVRDNPQNIDALEGQGLTLMAMGKSVDASRLFSDVIERDPKRWRSLNALGILFITKNMIPEAMAYYMEALKYSPDNPAILNNIGLSQAIDTKYERAIAALEQAGRLSKSSSQRQQIELNTALVYGISGDLDHAREIASRYYDGAALDNNMGLYAHLAKNDSLAKTYLNMALSQSPTFYERAWSNLDAVNDGGNPSESTTTKSGTTTVTPPPATKPSKKK